MHESERPPRGVEMAASPAHPLRIRRFRGVRLSPERVANPAVARAFARPYREVAQRLLDWQSEGFVEIDHTPALYLHEYTAHGMTVRGLVCTLDLSTRATTHQNRSIFGHEGIHPEQADELAERMHEMGINPAPILLVHHGPEEVRTVQREVMEKPPTHAYEDRGGQQHRLWVVDSTDHVRRIEDALEDSRLMIADGHHRYAAYLRLQERHPGTAWDRGLVMVVDQDDTPLFLGAIHRTLRGADLPSLAAAARDSGLDVLRTDRETALRSLTSHTWLVTDGDEWLSIHASDPADVTSPVETLHQGVIPRLKAAPAVQHHHTAEDALASARADAVAVILPAPEYELLDRSMQTGTLLPEKATSFQPKPNLGVLMRSVDSELLEPLP